jgi:hypothetical protein
VRAHHIMQGPAADHTCGATPTFTTHNARAAVLRKPPPLTFSIQPSPACLYPEDIHNNNNEHETNTRVAVHAKETHKGRTQNRAAPTGLLCTPQGTEKGKQTNKKRTKKGAQKMTPAVSGIICLYTFFVL